MALLSNTGPCSRSTSVEPFASSVGSSSTSCVLRHVISHKHHVQYCKGRDVRTRFTPVHHSSHLEEELDAMQQSVRKTEVKSGRPHLLHLRSTGHGPHVAQLPENFDLDRGCQALAHHLWHLSTESKPDEVLRHRAAAEITATCVLSYASHQVQQLLSLVQHLQQQLAEQSSDHALAVQPVISEDNGSYIQGHEAQKHHPSSDYQLLVALVPAADLPEAPAAAADASDHGDNPQGSVTFFRCSISQGDGPSPSGSVSSRTWSGSTMSSSSSSQSDSDASASSSRASANRRPSYASNYLTAAAGTTPILRVSSSSDPRAITEFLTSSVLNLTPTLLHLGTSKAASLTAAQCLTKARRRLVQWDSGVDLIAVVVPCKHQEHLHEASHRQHHHQQSAAGALSGTGVGLAPLGERRSDGKHKGRGGSGVGGGQRQEQEGVAVSREHQHGMDLLVLPWWPMDV